MPYDNVIYTVDDKIARIVFNRPHKLNAINEAMWHDLESALEEADRNDNVRVIIISGAGRAFCSGIDLTSELAAGETLIGVPRPTLREALTGPLSRLTRYQSMWNLSKPTIAQVHGYCLAGGCYFQLLCDITIASDDAIFGHPGQRFGGASALVPLWTALLGPKRAKELLFSAKNINAKEAERIGLINRAVPREKLESEVNELASQIISLPADGVAVTKEAVNMTMDIFGITTAFRYIKSLEALGAFREPPEYDFKGEK